MKKKSLIIKNLNFQYSKNREQCPTLKNINLELEEGELASLIGPSGCGKSSLLRVLSGFEFPSSGYIYLNDQDITKTLANKRNIGMVFQDYALFPHLTSSENILIALKKKDYSHELYQRLTHLFQIQDILDNYPHQISGGQMQRVAIVRTLIRSPEIILLDEPFSGLDKNLKKKMAFELRGLFKSLNTTAIMVTHDQEEAFSFSDKIGVMIQGEILDWNSPRDLYYQPKNKIIADFLGDASFVSIDNFDNNIKCAIKMPSHFSPPKNLKSLLYIKPEQIQILLDSDQENISSTQGEVVGVEFRGSKNLISIRLFSGEIILAEHSTRQSFTVNQKIHFVLNIDSPIFY